MKLPTPAFPIGTRVYLRVNYDCCGLVVSYMVRPNNLISYFVCWNDAATNEHFEMELDTEKAYTDGVE